MLEFVENLSAYNGLGNEGFIQNRLKDIMVILTFCQDSFGFVIYRSYSHIEIFPSSGFLD